MTDYCNKKAFNFFKAIFINFNYFFSFFLIYNVSIC